MTKLHDALEDLTTGVPSYVEVDAPAAWRVGRRRRLRRFAASGAVVVVVAALMASAFALPQVERSAPADSPPGGVTGYPTRIEEPGSVNDLPAKPGPLAGLVLRGVKWYALSPSGEQWLLIKNGWGEIPALSPDGTVVVYLDREAGELVIHDLVTGKVQRLAEFRGGAKANDGYWGIYGGTSHFWSPDGERLLVAATPSLTGEEDDNLRPVLDVRTGAITPVRVGLGIDGWYDDDTLIQVGRPDRRTVRVRLMGLDGELERSVDLTPAEPLVEDLGRGSAAYSPETGELLLVAGSWEDGEAHVLSMDQPGPATVTPAPDAAMNCSHGWAGELPYVNTAGGAAPTALVTAAGLTPMVTAEDAGAVDCIIWARDAISGTPNDVVDTSDPWWTWWWHERSIGIALLLCLVGAVLWRRTHPRRPT